MKREEFQVCKAEFIIELKPGERRVLSDSPEGRLFDLLGAKNPLPCQGGAFFPDHKMQVRVHEDFPSRDQKDWP